MKQVQRARAEGIFLTDQYELTMAQLYYRHGLHEKPVLFDHFFRNYPDYGEHKAGFCVTAGLSWLLNWMEEAHIDDADLEALRKHTGRTGERTFDDDFLSWLGANGSFDGLTIHAIPEGRVVHPHVPIAVVEGPLAQAQLLETALLNHLNYQTLVATKAARIRESGQGQLLLEFGLRRAHDRGATAGARAALVGGADFTSYVGVSHELGIEPKGTHAHSMVQVFMALGEGELGAFRAYADVYPDDCLLLVDTIDTLESGVPNAIKVFEELREEGHDPVGIRLDSGDLAYLSIRAAQMLNQAGFEDTVIVLSNNLDELVIWQILTQIAQEAPEYGLDADHVIGRLAFGVGTRLITSWGEPALGGVYKLVAAEQEDGWRPAIKISESAEKIANPGRKRAWRLYDKRGYASADLVTLAEEEPSKRDRLHLHHPYDVSRRRTVEVERLEKIEPLLEPVMKSGRRLVDEPELEELRGRRERDVSQLDPGVRRLLNPHRYHVSLSSELWRLKQELVSRATGDRSLD
ncbi:MAG: nicotinate phosphoribosyltransferase [Anaerolineales bacterium]|nr:nicotinate phosphoribosyltransferase [Anaerolineales bacterium]